jgi:hypothetical protein
MTTPADIFRVVKRIVELEDEVERLHKEVIQPAYVMLLQDAPDEAREILSVEWNARRCEEREEEG